MIAVSNEERNCLLSARQIFLRSLKNTFLMNNRSFSLCLPFLQAKSKWVRNVNLDSGWGDLDCILDIHSDLGCGWIRFDFCRAVGGFIHF